VPLSVSASPLGMSFSCDFLPATSSSFAGGITYVACTLFVLAGVLTPAHPSPVCASLVNSFFSTRHPYVDLVLRFPRPRGGKPNPPWTSMPSPVCLHGLFCPLSSYFSSRNEWGRPKVLHFSSSSPDISWSTGRPYGRSPLYDGSFFLVHKSVSVLFLFFQDFFPLSLPPSKRSPAPFF